MTRKELSIEIAKGMVKRLNMGAESIARIARGLYYGAGAAKPSSKPDMIKWYNDLVQEGFIEGATL